MGSDFYGLPVQHIDNGQLRVEFLTTAGPRVVRLFLEGGTENLLAETFENGWDTPYGKYWLYGGHRLWLAPEVFPATSFPDNDPVQVTVLENGVRLQQQAESISGLVKSIELRLAPERARLTLVHCVQNEGNDTRELALWSITELPLGGVALFPCPNEPMERYPLAPNRHIALWPCSRWTDTRLELSDEMLKVHARAELPPYKIGYLNRSGWIAYLNAGVLLVKRFSTHPQLPHTDANCNAEAFVNDQYIELETLGPLTRLEPLQSVSHVETWTLYPDIQTVEQAVALAERE